MDRTAPIRPREPSVHRRQEGHAEAAEQWQMQQIDVRVHDSEIFHPPRDRMSDPNIRLLLQRENQTLAD
jgi:hypothetical protein